MTADRSASDTDLVMQQKNRGRLVLIVLAATAGIALGFSRSEKDAVEHRRGDLTADHPHISEAPDRRHAQAPVQDDLHKNLPTKG